MGVIVAQAKKSKLLKFHALKEALEGPGELLLNDFSMFDCPSPVQLAV